MKVNTLEHEAQVILTQHFAPAMSKVSLKNLQHFVECTVALKIVVKSCPV